MRCLDYNGFFTGRNGQRSVIDPAATPGPLGTSH